MTLSKTTPINHTARRSNASLVIRSDLPFLRNTPFILFNRRKLKPPLALIITISLIKNYRNEALYFYLPVFLVHRVHCRKVSLLKNSLHRALDYCVCGKKCCSPGRLRCLKWRRLGWIWAVCIADDGGCKVHVSWLEVWNAVYTTKFFFLYRISLKSNSLDWNNFWQSSGCSFWENILEK